jgi:hypothetical protein
VGTEDGTIDFTGDADARDSNEEWDPDNSDSEDSEDSEEADSDTEIEIEIDDDDDTAMVTTSDDEDDLGNFKLDGTEEDGYGRRVTRPREKPSRKRTRSNTSFELPDPPSADGPSSLYAQETDMESSAPPSKRRRMETARGDDSSERPKTESAVMLKKFYDAAKRAVSSIPLAYWPATDNASFRRDGKGVKSCSTFRKRR